MIDVLSVDSYPQEFEYYIMDYFSKMPDDIISEIKNYKILYKKDVSCAIEDYLNPTNAYTLYKDLIAIMDKYIFIVYHATKVTKELKIEMNGLRVNDWDRYSKSLIDALIELGFNSNDIKETLRCVEIEHHRKFNNHAQLCFFSSLNLIGGEHSGYEQFCENIGGELAKWALQEKHPDIYDVLKENGIAVFVKFKLPFKNIVMYEKEIILYQFVCYYAANEFFNYDYQVEFDGKTHKDVPSNDILEILPCPKNILNKL